VLAACPPFVYSQDFTPIFNGKNLSGWKSEYKKVDVRDGVIQLGSGNGWLRTERVLTDFVVKLDLRVKDQKTSAGVFVRAWPFFTGDRTPNTGYQLRLVDGAEVSAVDEWQRIEVECAGQTVRIRVNGSLVFSSDVIRIGQGHLALWSKGGTAQFRGIEIKELPPAFDTAVGTRMIGNGVSSPRVIQDPKPRYTADALRAGIAGTVVMTGVVLPDGTVSNIVVSRSLDQKYGLDYEAINTATRWRFEPGTLNGQPVPVRIVIELAFNNK
jgi:TonB family protein